MLEVRVDGASGLRGFGDDGDGPRTALVFSGGEEADETEQLVAFANEPDKAALMEAVAGKEFGSFVFVHIGKLCLDFATDGGGSGIGALGHFFELETAYR